MAFLLTTTITDSGSLSAPVISGVPTISGTAQENQALTATAASVTGNPSPTRGWQWKSDGVNVGSDQASYALQASDVGNTITVTQTETNSEGSDSATSTATATVSAAPSGAGNILSVTARDQDAGGTVDLVYQVTGTTTVNMVLTDNSTTPTEAQISAGQDHLGNAATDSYSGLTWTTGGADGLPAIADGIAAGTYYFHAIEAGAADGDAVSSNGFTLDTVAPVVSSASTNAAGDLITITMSKEVFGAGDTTKWTLNGISGTQTIEAVTITGSSVALQLGGNPAIGSDTIALDYANGDVKDATSNDLANFSGQAVTNNVPATYTEALVTVNNTPDIRGHLNAPAALPSGTTGLFFFFSGAQAANDQRRSIVNFGRSNRGIWSDYGATSGQWGAYVDMEAGARASHPSGAGEQIAHGARGHVLGSLVADGAGNLTIKMSYAEASSAWVDVANVVATGANATLDDVAATPARLFQLVGADFDSGTEGHPYKGTCARFAVWSNTDNTEIFDPTSGTVQSNFVSGGVTVDPATARTAYGTPNFDFNGPARLYNKGLHYGSLPNFTLSDEDFLGAFS